MAANAYSTPTPGPLGDKPYGADFDAGVTTRPFILYTEAGVPYYLWFGTSDKLYFKKTTAPTTATDGTVVGTQT